MLLWLRIHLAMQESDMWWTPGQGTNIPHDTEQLSLHTTTIEAHAPQLGSPRTTAKIQHATAKTLCSQTSILKNEYPDTNHNSQCRSESGELIAMIKMVGSGIRVLKGIAKLLPYMLH